MKNSALFLALLEIATANPDGFTVNAQTLQPITKGYAVALADTQDSHDTAGLLWAFSLWAVFYIFLCYRFTTYL